MKQVSTLFLKVSIIVIALVALVPCVFILPQVWIGGQTEIPDHIHILFVGLIGIYLTILPFYVALLQAFTLLQYIDAHSAFSDRSVIALKRIKYAAIAMTGLYTLALPLAYVVAELDDAPGLILISTGFACAPLVVATFAAVLEKLVRSAVDMKNEHDLTV